MKFFKQDTVWVGLVAGLGSVLAGALLVAAVFALTLFARCAAAGGV